MTHDPYKILLRLAISEMRVLAEDMQPLDAGNVLGQMADGFIHTANVLLIQAEAIEKHRKFLIEQEQL